MLPIYLPQLLPIAEFEFMEKKWMVVVISHYEMTISGTRIICSMRGKGKELKWSK
jgi:hypothetical protein